MKFDLKWVLQKYNLRCILSFCRKTLSKRGRTCVLIKFIRSSGMQNSLVNLTGSRLRREPFGVFLVPRNEICLKVSNLFLFFNFEIEVLFCKTIDVEKSDLEVEEQKTNSKLWGSAKISLRGTKKTPFAHRRWAHSDEAVLHPTRAYKFY